MAEPAAAAPAPRRFTREITTVVAAPVLIWSIGWAPAPVYIAVLTLGAVLSLYEMLMMGEAKGYPVQKVLSIALMLLILASFLTALSVEVGVFAVLLAIPAAYVFARTDLREALPASAVCVLGILYIGMLAGSLLRLRLDFGDAGSRLVFFLLLVVWSGDAGAYYVGRRFGKTKLSPRVSPKKTVEGGLGGLIVSVLTAAIIHFTFFPEFPLIHAILAAMALSVTGMIGDLAESMFKRSAAVKDSGNLIPGHGGFLDRLDSILFTAPILYAYWFLITNPPEVTFP